MNTIINFLMAAAMQVLSLASTENVHQISEEIKMNIQQMEICVPGYILNSECDKSTYQLKQIEHHS